MAFKEKHLHLVSERENQIEKVEYLVYSVAGCNWFLHLQGWLSKKTTCVSYLSSKRAGIESQVEYLVYSATGCDRLPLA